MQIEQWLLWWDASQGRWIEADFDAFVRWRGLGFLNKNHARGSDCAWPLMREGDHRFVLLIADDDGQTVVNFIAHRYLAGPGGRFAGSPSTLSQSERAEWDKLYTQTTETVEDSDRLRELQDKEFCMLRLPLELLEAMVRDSPVPITLQTDYGFWQTYNRHGGNIPAMSRMN